MSGPDSSSTQNPGHTTQWDGADMSATVTRVSDALDGLRRLRQRVSDGHSTVARSLGGNPGTSFVNDANDFDLHFGDLINDLQRIQARLEDTHKTYGNALTQVNQTVGSIRTTINL